MANFFHIWNTVQHPHERILSRFEDIERKALDTGVKNPFPYVEWLKKWKKLKDTHSVSKYCTISICYQKLSWTNRHWRINQCNGQFSQHGSNGIVFAKMQCSLQTQTLVMNAICEAVGCEMANNSSQSKFAMTHKVQGHLFDSLFVTWLSLNVPFTYSNSLERAAIDLDGLSNPMWMHRSTLD